MATKKMKLIPMPRQPHESHGQKMQDQWVSECVRITKLNQMALDYNEALENKDSGTKNRVQKDLENIIKGKKKL